MGQHVVCMALLELDFVYIQAVVYKKYSTASDVWSYGIVLYEMWTIGEKPYGYSWSNNDVIEMLEKGYRLSPPPGCSRPVYELMISCWYVWHNNSIFYV